MTIPNTQFQGQYEPLAKVTAPDPSQTTVSMPLVSQVSTSAFVDVPGSKVDISGTLLRQVTYIVQETGGVNSVNFQVLASVDGSTWFMADSTEAIAGQVAFLGPMLYGVRYTKLQIEDAVSGSHGTVSVTGYAF